MNFFQKNKFVIVFLLIISFPAAILLIFVTGIADSNPRSTPTAILSSQQLTSEMFATSTSALQPVGTQTRDTPLTTSVSSSQTPTVAGPQGASSPPPTIQNSVTDVPPGTDAPPPPTSQNFVTDAAPGTNAPPPPTMQSPTPETPPPGNGPPPGS